MKVKDYFKEKKFPSHNIIGPNTVINGEIKSEGNLRVDGEFTGVIDISGELIIGQSGNVNGKVTAKRLEVSGKINAEMQIKDFILMTSTANVMGDIQISKIIIEDGAVFNGNCVMNPINKTI